MELKLVPLKKRRLVRVDVKNVSNGLRRRLRGRLRNGSLKERLKWPDDRFLPLFHRYRDFTKLDPTPAGVEKEVS